MKRSQLQGTRMLEAEAEIPYQAAARAGRAIAGIRARFGLVDH